MRRHDSPPRRLPRGQGRRERRVGARVASGARFPRKGARSDRGERDGRAERHVQPVDSRDDVRGEGCLLHRRHGGRHLCRRPPGREGCVLSGWAEPEREPAALRGLGRHRQRAVPNRFGQAEQHHRPRRHPAQARRHARPDYGPDQRDHPRRLRIERRAVAGEWEGDQAGTRARGADRRAGDAAGTGTRTPTVWASARRRGRAREDGGGREGGGGLNGCGRCRARS